MSGHAGVTNVVLTDPTGLTQQGTLTNPLRVDPVGTTSQPVTLSPTPPVTLLSVVSLPSTSGDTTLVAAQGTGNKIKVVAYKVSFNGTVNTQFFSDPVGVAIDGLVYGVSNSGAAESITPPNFLFQTAANKALVINLSANVSVGVRVTYYVGT